MELPEAIAWLRAHGALFVAIDYDGSGDSGEIENVTALTEREPDWGEGVIAITPDVQEALELAVQPTLDQLPNWDDGDGGFGDLLLDLTTGKIHCNHYQRYTETNNSTHDFTLEFPEPPTPVVF